MRLIALALVLATACSITGPRPPMVHDGVPPAKMGTPVLFMVRGDVLDQEVAVIDSSTQVREVAGQDIAGVPLRREGTDLIVRTDEGEVRLPASKVEDVTFTGPEIGRWKVARTATVFAAWGAFVGGGGTAISIGMGSRSDRSAALMMAPFLMGGWAAFGGAVGYVVGSISGPTLTLSSADGWRPAIPAKR